MSKIHLTHVKGESYFFSGRLSIGVYVQSGIATLIDSGIDKDNAKYVDKALQEEGYTVGAIINTHHHPDHCGGNNYFQKQYPNIKIFATNFESIFITNPFIHLLCFCGGAAPFAELRNKYLEAESSVVTDVIAPYQDQVIEINGARFTIITLPGHTFGSIGVITPDNVFYSGDALFGEDTFNKHGVLFYTNIQDSLTSFKKISSLSLDSTVFYHGGLIHEIASVAEKHAQRMLETKNTIASMITSNNQGLSIDQVTQQVMNKYKIPESIMPFTLTRSCVHAYITQLNAENEVSLVVQDGLLRAQKV